MDMNMKVWKNQYSFAHKDSAWMNYQSSKAILKETHTLKAY